ncbi:MAG: ABC transporter permease [Defluviitaleaceae bacterium]|nr:ABC transporter permease [Defluviitaleaceae bacterium]
MKNTKAIFFKQFQSLLRNPGMIVQAILFLVLVIIMTFLIGGYEDTDCESCIPAYVCTPCLEGNTYTSAADPSLTGLFTVMFVGFALVGSASALVIEDKTTQNLRFMAMADVKPWQYLVGTVVSMAILSVGILALYALVGRYLGVQMIWFMAITMSGAIVSILLGLVVGLSKAPGLTTLLSLVLGLGPMLSGFNEALARVLRFTFTQQVNLAVSDLSADLSTNFMIIGANGAVILLLFVWMHRKGVLG